jgi:RNA polymerase-binding transcription factor DksA
MKSTAERKTQLEARREELQSRIGGIVESLDSHQETDWEELATEREDDEVMEGMGLEAQTELRAIDAALKRIDAGTYGFCQTCGEAISEARLDLLPYTPFCKEHAT